MGRGGEGISHWEIEKEFWWYGICIGPRDGPWDQLGGKWLHSVGWPLWALKIFQSYLHE